jgi:hypothetical protein
MTGDISTRRDGSFLADENGATCVNGTDISFYAAIFANFNLMPANDCGRLTWGGGGGRCSESGGNTSHELDTFLGHVCSFHLCTQTSRRKIHGYRDFVNDRRSAAGLPGPEPVGQSEAPARPSSRRVDRRCAREYGGPDRLLRCPVALSRAARPPVSMRESRATPTLGENVPPPVK